MIAGTAMIMTIEMIVIGMIVTGTIGGVVALALHHRVGMIAQGLRAGITMTEGLVGRTGSLTKGGEMTGVVMIAMKRDPQGLQMEMEEPLVASECGFERRRRRMFLQRAKTGLPL